MRYIVDSPLLVLAISLAAMWLSAHLGSLVSIRIWPLQEDERPDLNIALGATLTLLGLIIGFSFSMVVTRYDQRKNYEEAEANAIGTEYLRADLLSAEDAARVRQLLKDYLAERILFYEAVDLRQLEQNNGRTAQLQAKLWAVVQATAARQPTPTIALAVSGMNDVLNSQGYTQAAWWNRFPLPAWGLMVAIALICNFLIGYGSRQRRRARFLVLPLSISISFFLIADISSPRRGLIRVVPQNLVSLAQSLGSQ